MLSREDRDVLKKAVSIIKRELHDGNVVMVRKFGTFHPVHKKAHTAFNPAKKKIDTIKGRKTVVFKPSKYMVELDV